MNRVVSISLGSKKRDHKVEMKILGREFVIERIGTDGDLKKAVELIRKLDGKVNAFGMGGIDLYIVAGNKRYMLKDARVLKEAARLTPIVDGSGLKNTLERKVINYLDDNIFKLRDKKVLMVCGVDRFGMAEELEKVGAKVFYGDLIFGLGIPYLLKSLKNLERVAKIIAPIASRLPFELIYPTGKNQETVIDKYASYYLDADIIAGDFLFIRRYLPATLENKIILTNTVTLDDVHLLKTKGVKELITTTPELNGRSFGTNVMEALMVALADSDKELSAEEYEKLLEKLGFIPRVLNLKEQIG